MSNVGGVAVEWRGCVEHLSKKIRRFDLAQGRDLVTANTSTLVIDRGSALATEKPPRQSRSLVAACPPRSC